MKILQSTVERLLYILLGLMVVVLIVLAGFVGAEYHKVNTILSNHTSTINTVEANQHTNALAIKNYIACLLTLSSQSKATIQAQEQVCFDSAPQVK